MHLQESRARQTVQKKLVRLALTLPASLNIANLQFNMAYIVAICNNNASDSEPTFDKYITKYCNDCIVCFTTSTESCKCCLYFISVLVQQK